MAKQASVFPWVPEYDDGFVPYFTDDEPGLVERGIVAISSVVFSSVELYLVFFFTYVVTGLLIAQ